MIKNVRSEVIKKNGRYWKPRPEQDYRAQEQVQEGKGKVGDDFKDAVVKTADGILVEHFAKSARENTSLAVPVAVANHLQRLEHLPPAKSKMADGV